MTFNLDLSLEMFCAVIEKIILYKIFLRKYSSNKAAEDFA